MSRKTQPKRTELFRDLAAGLRNAAQRPNIYGYEPHGKQVVFHSSGARGKLFIGGNRSGKTVGGATEAIWRATGRHPYHRSHPPPTRGRVVAVDLLNGVEKIVRPEIARWLPASDLKGGSWMNAYDKELRTLTLENGSTIEFMSYEQDLEKFAGTSRHWTWFDEEPPQDIFTECKMRLLDVAGDWWITMTPVEGMTWTFDDLYEPGSTGDDPNILVVEVDTTENPHLNPGEIDLMLSGMSEDEKTARIHGQYVRRGGLIYKNFSEAVHVVDPILPPVDWLHVAALDHGFNNPTAWLWGAVDKDGRILIYDEHYKSGWVIAQHAEEVHKRNQNHERVPSYYVGDPSIRNTDPITGTSVQIEYIDCGLPVILGNNDVKAGLDRVYKMFGEPHVQNAQLPPRLFVTRNCVNLIWELKRYRWASWANKKLNFDKNKKEEPNKKDDHACDALRYFIASRPLTEDGSIPENSIPYDAVVANSPYRGLTDPGVSKTTLRENYDPLLGTEW